jgi:hypothetical protein
VSLSRSWLRRLPSVSDRWVLVGLLVVHLLIVFARLGPLLRHPTEYLFVPGGDGLKTYYALLYYVQTDHGMHFSGLNYPHGELLTFTDGFPLLAWLLQCWHSWFGLSPAGVVGAFNLTIILASLPTSPLVYTLLRRALVGRWFAVAATVAIVFLSPQFQRLNGHFTLALPLVVPLLWYLQIRLTEALTQASRLRWLLIYAATAFLLALIHPYYLLHALLLPAATAVVLAVQRVGRRGAGWWHMPAWLLGLGLTPVVLFQVWISLLDTIKDRPTNPYGFFVYHSNFASIFGPPTEPFAAVFKFIFHTDEPISEGIAYIGLPVVLGMLLLVLRVAWHLLHRRPKWVLRPALPGTLPATVWAAVLILFFAMGWPFVFPGFEGLLDLLPALKQFRSLGRFAWIFYYIMAVVAVVQYWQLYRLLRQRGAHRVARLLLAGVLVVWGFEAKYQYEAEMHQFPDNRVASEFIGEGGNYAEFLAQAGVYADHFQAVLPLPYYSVGSEKFAIEGSGTSVYEGFKAALSIKRPLAAVMMSRSSTEHSLRLLELFSSDLTPKSLPGQLPSQQPFLVVASRLDSLRPAEKNLLRRGAKLLAETNQVRLYELPLSAFATTRPAEERARFAATQAQLLHEGPLWRTTPGPAIIWRTFADHAAPTGVSFTQPGAASGDKGTVPMYEGPLPGATDSTTYELSVWAYAKTTDWLPYVSFRQLDAGGQEVERREESLKGSSEIHGDWVRYSMEFKLKAPGNHIVVEGGGDDFVFDDLLIRPIATNVYWLDARQQPVLNGFPLAP